ncbi:thermonuclease family protein [Selenomonadales bacterium OttesenSCG-928-I06]|nr:thermonuclease family protein [Selenomonadales bacterium OttesenSCG-928-I06]
MERIPTNHVVLIVLFVMLSLFVCQKHIHAESVFLYITLLFVSWAGTFLILSFIILKIKKNRNITILLTSICLFCIYLLSSSSFDNPQSYVQSKTHTTYQTTKHDYHSPNRTIQYQQDEDSSLKYEEAKVIKVINGDIIEVRLYYSTEIVCLIGVDIPEAQYPNKYIQYYEEEAYQFTKEKLEGKTVYLEYDVTNKDKYGRHLAYVWLSADDNDLRDMFNSVLLLEGYAQVMTVPPNVKYSEQFLDYQREAKENNRGLWNKIN